MKLTAIVEKGEQGWFVGQIEEIPAVIAQGTSVADLKSNLIDALNFYFEVQKDTMELEYAGRDVIREELVIV
jgi:predicted RNase H-like HicB family nuclease